MMKYNPAKIEKHWQKYWEAKKLYDTKDGENNYMLLTEFPYTSGNLHMGHWYAYTPPDILGRYLRMNGYNVLYPIGFDAFGLPAENAAIQRNISPNDWTEANIKNMTKQLKSTGAAFDWSREVKTNDPEYYKWTQWIFLKLYEKGLAYRAKTLVNWCPKDKTVLANEQVIGGRCFRDDELVVQKEIEQWMFKITDYADRLVDDLGGLDWPEVTKVAQKNWVGRSEGAKIKFDGKHPVEVFTTRPDTIFGATFLVVSPELTKKWLDAGWQADEGVKKYIQESLSKKELDRLEQQGEKTGIDAGIKAINPATKEEIPVWIADYVLGGYGTGAIMAVPAHDQRDFEFAEKFNLPVKMVICPNYPEKTCPILDRAYEGDGCLVGSGKFDGVTSEEAKWEITKFVGGERQTRYKLRDWVLSRQRYWGVPIPMVYCDKCGYQPIPEKDLPVKLPKLEDFKPSENGRSPLAKAEKWVKTKCPKCGKQAERETDTMDTFVDSSWYFIRYTDPKNKKEFANPDKIREWLPAPIYIGGADHNTMHLLYSRFLTKVLYDLEYLPFSEPFLRRINRGWVLGPNHQKMSKSKGNVIDPDAEVEKYGADTVRMYLAFMGPFEQGGSWDLKGINGVFRFLNRVWNFINKPEEPKVADQEVEKALHKSAKEIGEDIKNLKFNTGVSGLMKLLNAIEDKWLTKKQYETFLKLLAPFAPHIAEEIWQDILGNKKSIHLEAWPEYDEKYLQEETVDLVVQINGKTRDVLKVARDSAEEKIKEMALDSEKIKRHLEGKQIKKTIFIQNRLVNFIV
ncbi:MAG: leucine--tRNA ligase [bacterium]|nr:leucine--tRNA ligase [bacterium]